MGSGSGFSCSINLRDTLTKEEQAIYQNPETVRHILFNSRTIAMVGLSAESHKASNMVATYLRSAGYRIIPVNPRADSILGEKCYPDLRSIPEPVDLVDIFRPSQACLDIVEEAIACGAKAVWMQLSIANVEAAKLALDAGLMAVMDMCVKMEHGRYSGGLHEAGMNTEIVSARRIHRYV
ncbi:MAG TPA: CoA-binding protein [Anaerovoracaceae bacterium]|nr:CoA-binding protein [Anaerovoracaceae bacterium]